MKSNVAIGWITCQHCGALSRTENGISLHTEETCSDALEFQRLSAVGDEEGLANHFRLVNEKLLASQPKVYCELCNKVLVGKHQHWRGNRVIYTAVPFTGQLESL